MQGLLEELENKSKDFIKPDDYEIFIRATAKLIDLMKYKYVSAQEKVKNRKWSLQALPVESLEDLFKPFWRI